MIAQRPSSVEVVGAAAVEVEVDGSGRPEQLAAGELRNRIGALEDAFVEIRMAERLSPDGASGQTLARLRVAIVDRSDLDRIDDLFATHVGAGDHLDAGVERLTTELPTEGPAAGYGVALTDYLLGTADRCRPPSAGALPWRERFDRALHTLRSHARPLPSSVAQSICLARNDLRTVPAAPVDGDVARCIGILADMASGDAGTRPLAGPLSQPAQLQCPVDDSTDRVLATWRWAIGRGDGWAAFDAALRAAHHELTPTEDALKLRALAALGACRRGAADRALIAARPLVHDPLFGSWATTVVSQSRRSVEHDDRQRDDGTPLPLDEYFAGSRARPDEVVGRRDGPAVSADEVARGKGAVATHDRDFARLRALVIECGADAGRRATSIRNFAASVVNERAAARGHKDVLGDGSSEQILQRASRAFGPSSAGAEGREAGLNLLGVALLLIAARDRDLTPERAARVLADTPGLTTTPMRWVLFEAIAGDLASVVPLVAPLAHEAERERDRGRALEAERSAAQADRDRARAAEDVALRRIEELESTLAEERAEADSLRRQLGDRELLGKVDVRAVQRRTRTRLRRAMSAVEIAREAASLEPPRADVMRQEVEAAFDVLADEFERLGEGE